MELFTETPGTFILILLNAVVTLFGWHKKDWFYKLVLHPFRVFRKEHLAGFFLSGFLHKNLSHFGINMGVLYVFGSNMEVTWNDMHRQGSILILITFLFCILISNGISVWYNRSKLDYTLCGSSPAVIGILSCFIGLEPMALHNYIHFSVSNLMLIPIYIVGLMLAHLYRKEKIDYLGHFSGLLMGQIIILVL